MIVHTARFGQLSVDPAMLIRIPFGILGFPNITEYVLVDPGDDTLILWLQAVNGGADIAFPVLEPKVFKPDYAVTLSGADRRELEIESLKDCAVLSVLTIPAKISEMTANLKAPLVLNLKNQVAKQVVLQENDLQIRHSMFKELRAHLSTIRAATEAQAKAEAAREGSAEEQFVHALIQVRSLPASNAVRP